MAHEAQIVIIWPFIEKLCLLLIHLIGNRLCCRYASHILVRFYYFQNKFIVLLSLLVQEVNLIIILHF